MGCFSISEFGLESLLLYGEILKKFSLGAKNIYIKIFDTFAVFKTNLINYFLTPGSVSHLEVL